MPDPRHRPAFVDDLAETRAHAWRQLARGVADRRSSFHTPSVATIGLDGRPRLRTVVLRGVEPAAARLRFHTDARADKVAELSADPRIALHAYDAAGKFQLRIEGLARLHRDDATADAAWAGSRPMSRACYGTVPAPGSRLAGPNDFTLPADEAALDAGRGHFCVVVIDALTLETLALAHEGHRRARFDLRSQADSGVWLVP